MAYMIWIGAVISVLGLCGVIYSVIAVARAKRSGMGDAALRARIGQVMPINLGAFLSAMLGLAMVLVGSLLG